MRWKIIAVLLVLAIGGYFFFSNRSSVPAAPKVVSFTQMHQAWLQGVTAALKQYDQDQDAAKAQSALLALTVASVDRDLHLQLVLAFSNLATNQPKAAQKLEQARTIFSNFSASGTQADAKSN